MAVLTIVNYAATDNLTLPVNEWTSLLGGAHSVTGLGGGITILGYAYNLDYSQVSLRIVVDGTELLESPSADIMINTTLSLGSHTIDLQAFPLNSSQTATVRGCTAFTL